MKVLSLFDGMACGALALKKCGIEIESYDAYEIEENAIKTAIHNFPFIKQHGDVFSGDFTQHQDVDLLCGGSPCTYWSIAQKNGRETEASGLGWELFQQYVRAIKEARPKYFVYENNKSMSKAIRNSIDEAFGFEAVMINSALVSAQKRERLYWVGKRNEDGTYSKVDVPQPEDKGILLKDIIEHGVAEKEKSYCLCSNHVGTTRDYFKKRQSQVVFEPVRLGDIGSTSQAHRVYSCYGKTVTMSANGGGQGGKTGLYFVPLPEKLQGLVCDKGKIYEVKDGKIETKSGTWDVNLPDGLYLIRKLTVREAARCQTIPDWYDFGVVSDTQAYKQIGNGWTVDVIAHIFTFLDFQETVSEPRKLKVLELFAGTRSIGKAFESKGHEVFSVEWDKDFENINLYEDIGKLTAEDILQKFGKPDVIWASPDCSTFSVAAISKHRRKNLVTGNLDPITEYAKFCDEVDQHVLELIKELNPKFYFIENPRGGMRKMTWMQGLPRYTVTYCQYGETRMKPTDIWTNHPEPQFKPPCKNGDKCHEAAPRGSQTEHSG